MLEQDALTAIPAEKSFSMMAAADAACGSDADFEAAFTAHGFAEEEWEAFQKAFPQCPEQACTESSGDGPCLRWVDKPTRRLGRKTLSWQSFDNPLNDIWWTPWDPRPLEEMRARC